MGKIWEKWENLGNLGKMGKMGNLGKYREKVTEKFPLVHLAKESATPRQ